MTTPKSKQSKTSYDGWIGRDAYDRSGKKIGEITDIFYDDKTRRPEWVAVKTGMFGAKNTFVPIHGAELRTDGGDLQLAFDKDMVKDAPRIDPDNEHMTPDEERELWAYYGYDYTADTTARNTDYGYGERYKTRPDTDYQFRRYNDKNKDWSEERRLQEHTEEVPVQATATVQVPVEANVRLRRYQTQHQKTETRTVEVPVTETEEHTEVVGVDAKAKGADVAGTANTIRNQPRP